jgi:hypothetical protein
MKYAVQIRLWRDSGIVPIIILYSANSDISLSRKDFPCSEEARIEEISFTMEICRELIDGAGHGDHLALDALDCR